MPEGFIPLDVILRAHSPEPPVIEEVEEPTLKPNECVEQNDALGEVRRFRAALADAFDVALAHLLEDVAASVLARELALRPADLGAIAKTALARYDAEDIVRVRVHPEDTAALCALDVRVVADARLSRGDAILEVRSGTIELTLGARLEAILRQR
jgi:flagellar biosynthesis/type III secretory pathway protein FliH